MLLSTEDMYANYRACWSRSKFALPFLFPHVFMLRKATTEVEKGRIISDLFRFVAYPGWSRCIKDNLGTDSGSRAAGAEIIKRPRTLDSLWAFICTVFTLLTAFLLAIRYWASCLIK